ncbi:uncharacterized protein BDZ99DRAFT_450171 [Mytilinidion resinicola]|uniref:Uncharacterized protein n=1 Tax=Mytilinidion resinicola TaxID=574789 RepID=A0A6A6YCI4_9PEZI|nr:uncharacterized protein BDZ99DRAFT_450171 [Mytilinidion resinicola]KAF2805547.1 hypothetical protein BDZ99DRAFT_450171 [Mytilinidion resinicola]
MILQIIRQGLQGAADSREEIRDHFESIFQSSIFEPETHDRLLFDDDSFSRSRLYFWAVDSLALFQSQVQDAAKQWDLFWKAKESDLRHLEDAKVSKFGKGIISSWKMNDEDALTIQESAQLVDVQCQRLRDLSVRFKDLHGRAIGLRDGLFNASSVIEAREATKLAENVKLLTYVTIFFLPLGFCVALWSMNDNIDTIAFAVTTTAVALGTYVLVANLNNFVGGIKIASKKLRKDVIASMEKEKSDGWKKLGKGFGTFKPDREKITPSEWWVVYYIMVKLVRTPRPNRLFRRLVNTKASSDEERQGGSPEK